MAHDDEWMTFGEVLAYLKIARSTLYRLMWGQKLPGYKVGATWRFKRADVQAWQVACVVPLA